MLHMAANLLNFIGCSRSEYLTFYHSIVKLIDWSIHADVIYLFRNPKSFFKIQDKMKRIFSINLIILYRCVEINVPYLISVLHTFDVLLFTSS